MSDLFKQALETRIPDIYVRPKAWRCTYDEGLRQPIIHCWGYSPSGESTYVRINHKFSSLGLQIDSNGKEQIVFLRDYDLDDTKLPISVLSSFFQATGVRPYQWFCVKNFKNLGTLDGNSKLQYFTFEQHVGPVTDEQAEDFDMAVELNNLSIDSNAKSLIARAGPADDNEPDEVDLFQDKLPGDGGIVVDRVATDRSYAETERERLERKENAELAKLVNGRRPRKLAWDIEVYSKTPDFPVAETDPIFMISSVNENGAVLFTTCDVNEEQLQDDFEIASATLINKDKDGILFTEGDLISGFFAFLEDYDADRQFDFNGKFFDWTYLAKRASINGIPLPKSVRAPSIPTQAVTKVSDTKWGQQQYTEINIAGTEKCDLLEYFRMYYPWFGSHRLQSVCEEILDAGKEDVSMDELRDAVATNDPIKLAPVAIYSLVDSYRLIELIDALGIDNQLDRVCNRLMCTIKMLTGKSSQYLLKNLAVNLFPGESNVDKEFTYPAVHFMKANLGIYKDVVNVRYDNVYLDIMLRQKDTRISEIASHLIEAPPALIFRAFFSAYNDAFDRCNLELTTFVDSMRQYGLFAVDAYTMRFTSKPIGANTVSLITIQNIKVFAQVDVYSWLYVDSKNELHVYGKSKLSTMEFPYMADTVRDYLSYITNPYTPEETNTVRPPFTFPDIVSIDKRKLMMTTRVYSKSNKEPYSSLLAQYMQTGAPEIRTWIMVDYIKVPGGVQLLNKDSDLEKMDLDYNWYVNEVANRIKSISKLPLV